MAGTSDPLYCFCMCTLALCAVRSRNRDKEQTAGQGKEKDEDLIYPPKASPTSSTHHVLMWKLDNKIRTCLLALCGTYQYRNLIPESVSLLSWFRAFTIDLITGLSDEAPNNRPVCRGAVFDCGTHKARSHQCSRSTKDPLCQHWGSGGGQISAGNSHPNSQHQNGLFLHTGTVFQSRPVGCTGAEQAATHWAPAGKCD